jgi:hypothetical protein
VRPTRLLLVVIAFGIVATGCSRGSQAALPTPEPGFCEAAQRYDRRVERDATLDEQITLVEKMARHAPKDVAADATLFLASLRKLRDGDESVVGDDDVEQAVDNVNRRAINGCEFFASEPGDGS